MDAMSNLRQTLDSLLDLQKTDSERDRLIRLRRNLDTGDAAASAAQQAQQSSVSSRSEHQRAAASLKDAELELAALEKKLKAYEDRVRGGQVSSPKELMNAEKEIGQLVRQREALDERILGLMDQVEDLKVKAKLADEQAVELDQRRAATIDKLAADRAKLEQQIADLGSRRAEIAATIDDAAMLKRYEIIRSRANSAGIAIARTIDNVCGSCHMQVSSIEASRAREGENLIICENCGRIMA